MSPSWSLLIISLPGRSATPRMRVWRGLKALGAAVLRDGVYLLPHGRSAVMALQAQAEVVRASGGEAHMLNFTGNDQAQTDNFRKLFDRTSEYARLIKTIQKLNTTSKKRNAAQASRQLRKIRREFDAIVATDYFPGPAKEQIRQLLSETELKALHSPGEPQARSGDIRPLKRADYRNRTWATRARPWVDRLASAWLIRRFIDPGARFVWLKDAKKCPARALGFDFDNAAFTHVGARVTFEVLLASFDLEKDAALTRLGSLVHYLDAGGIPVAEAPGLAMILNGARRQFEDDNKLFKEAAKAFDLLYASYTDEK